MKNLLAIASLLLFFSPFSASAQLGRNAIQNWANPTPGQTYTASQRVDFTGQVEIPANWRGVVVPYRNGSPLPQSQAWSNYGNASPRTFAISIPTGSWGPGTYSVHLEFLGADQCVVAGTCSSTDANRSFFQIYAPRTITVLAPVTQGYLTVRPSPLNFGSQAWNTGPVQRTVTIQNDGGASLSGNATIFSGAPYYQCVSGCSYTLAPGDSQAVLFSLTTPSSGRNVNGIARFSCGGCVNNPVNLSLRTTLYDPTTPPPSSFPVITVLTPTLDFDADLPTPTPTGQRETKKVLIRNTGGASAWVWNISFTGGGARTEFIPPSVTFAQIAPMRTAEFDVVFAPTLGGLATAVIEFSMGNNVTGVGAWSRRYRVTLSGTSDLTSIVDFRGSDTDFGDVILGDDNDQSVLVSNLGSNPLGSGTIEFPPGSPFSCVSPLDPMDGKCHYNIGANASASFLIRYRPLGPGLVMGNMTLSGYPAYPIELTGNGIAGAPAISLTNHLGVTVPWTTSPQFMDFGDQDIYAGEKELPFSLTNEGSAPSTIVFSTVSGDPAVFGKPLGSFDIPAGASVPFTVGFDPAVVGNGQTSVVNVIASGYPQPMVFNLSGNGTEAPPDIGPLTVDFGPVIVKKTKTLQFIIENNDVKDFGSPSIEIVGADQAVYSCTSGCEAAPLPPLSSRTITLTFSPTETRTYSAASLRFVGGINGIDTAAGIPMTGRGIRFTIQFQEL